MTIAAAQNDMMPAFLRLANVKKGDEMSVTRLPLTFQRLVIEAGVNRDFTPTHHDPDLAVRSGAPAPYANTPMILALLEAGVRNWMGIEGRILEIDCKMKKFNLAGSMLDIGGQVRAIGPLVSECDLDPAEWGEVQVDCWISSGTLRNVEGSARVALRKSLGH